MVPVRPVSAMAGYSGTPLPKKLGIKGRTAGRPDRRTHGVRASAGAASRYRDLVDRYQAGSVDRADELAAIATAAYEEGEFGILELLDAHRATLGARLRLLELSAAGRRAAIELDRAVGREVAP